MGDGRYYTFTQFINIFIITGLSGFAMFSIVFLNVNSRIKARIKPLIYLSVNVLVLLVFSFLRELVYEPEWYVVLSYLQMILALVAISYWVGNHTNKVLWIYILNTALVLFGGMNYIKKIDYSYTEYQWQYIVIVLILVIELIGAVIYELYRTSPETRYDKRYFMLKEIGPVAMVITYVLHLFIPLDIPLYYMGFVVALTAVMVNFLSFMPEAKTPLGINQVIGSMVDTIITLNEEYQVLDVNETELKSFVKTGKITLDDPHSFLCGEIKTVKKLSETVTEVQFREGATDYTIRYTWSQIIQKESCIGYILVIEDYSKQQQMIEKLKLQKDELIGVQKDLLMYSRTSNLYAAEKERSRLLVEVQNDLGHQLVELSGYISSMMGTISEAETGHEVPDLNQLRDALSKSIEMARSNLQNIRETVRIYRSSYNEGKRSRT